MSISYEKLYVSGDVVELFQYEKEPLGRRQDLFNSRHISRHRRPPTPDTQRLGKRQDNARRAEVAFGRLAQSNFSTSEIPVFSTLTFKTEYSGITIQSGYKLFNLFVARLKRRYGSHIRYLAVPEFGTRKTKRLHFHALFWGLPLEQIASERQTRDFAEVWSYGFVDLVITNNDPKVGYYLAKYLSKTYRDQRSFNSSSYSCSRNIRRPVCYNSHIGIVFEYVLGLSTEDFSFKKSYDTIFLGRCDYTLYNLIKKPEKICESS